MIDLRRHYISIDPQILDRNWQRYKASYLSIEKTLPKYSQIVSPFEFRIHLLGGFFVKKLESESPLKDLFENDKDNLLLRHNNEYYSRGLAYYPGLNSELSSLEKVNFIIKNAKNIVNAFAIETRCHIPGSVYPAIALDYVRNYLLILYHAFRLISERQGVIIGIPFN